MTRSTPRAATVCLLLLGLVARSVQAAPPLVGLWRTLDDSTGAPRSVVRLELIGDVLQGRIVRLLQPDDDPDSRCEACPGERRDQPVVGLLFLTGLRASPANALSWEGGEILDPETGMLYRARLQLDPSGKWLTVRAYYGVPVLGRSQTWLRMD